MKPYLLAGLLVSSTCFAQTLSAPDPQGVFGGRVLNMAQADDGVNFSRLYFATESANSIFYTDVQYTGGRPHFDTVMPLDCADWDDGYGSNVQQVQAYSTTGQVFFLAMGNVYSASPSSTSASMVMGMTKNFIIQGNVFLAVLNGAMPTSDDSLVYGTLDLSGNLSVGGGFGLTRKFNGPPQMIVDPTTNYLHLFEGGMPPYQMKIAENINSMTSSPTISSAVNPAPIDPNIEWMTFGIAPDGKWFVAGGPTFGAPPSTDRKVAYSSDNGMTWTSANFNLPGPPGGVPGQNFQFTAVGALQYGVYIGRAYSDSIGAPGSWKELGWSFTGNNNKANDGYVLFDSRQQSTAYITTNVGLGTSRWGGDTVWGANNGLTAVQVNDIDMTPSFATGWVASKSGIRKVEAYKSGSPVWSNPMFPNGDGSPYFEVAIDPSDSNTVYVGNGRVYKSINGGASWSLIFDPMMGGTHGATFNFPRVGTMVTGIAVSPIDPSLVMVTYSLDQSDDGGVMVTQDGGATWGQIPIVSGGTGQDVDATDVVCVDESGVSVFYVALQSDPLTPGYAGLYRISKGSGAFSTTADPTFGATDAILDLELSANQDTLLALYHTSSTINPPTRVYIKDIASGAWSFVVGPNGPIPTAITAGDGQVFLAQENEIYSHPDSTIAGPWSLAYSYPVGTRIQTLFYDELLVGTGTGLYAQDFDNNISVEEHSATEYIIYPNPSNGILHWDVEDNIVVTNLSGRDLVKEDAVMEVDLSSLPPGIYFIIGEVIGTHKIVVH
ncbi:MAG: T9SS type A sorting domain-containing protein [Flavobacteriia bacterium]|nr:T9SS type A sorting domain-containing protein [Flavobacteriia bacterium]